MKELKFCANCSTSLEDFTAKCTVCFNLFFCLNCFSTDLNFKDHEQSHSYIIENHSDEKNWILLLDEDENDIWTIEEEFSLLDAVEHFGFGSWIDVAEHVKTKSDTECESHYLKFYVEGNIGECTLSKIDHPICCDDTYAGDFYDQHFKPQNLTVEEQKELGYMPYRDDFIKEYDNEAETSICDICLQYTDSPIDLGYSVFKVSQLQERLRERMWRKRIATNHQLLHDSTSLGFRSWCVQRKKRSRELKSFQARYLTSAKYMTKKSYLEFFKNITRQERLMRHIMMLKKLHARGCDRLHGNFKKINWSLNGMSKRKKKAQRFYK